MNYEFPVKDKFQAREVTELDFTIEPTDETVYVNLDPVRDKSYLDQIKYNLNIEDDQLIKITDTFNKTIFSGHRGSGKSIELKRFHQSINKPDCYMSVHIDIEQEMEVGGFRSEDLFVILIAKLIERIDAEKISFESSSLDKIVGEWLSEKTIQEELKKDFKLNLEGEISAGNSFFGLLKFKSALKSIFSASSTTSESIRRKIRKNPSNLIDQFNDILSELRETLSKGNKAKDILFIFDGTEKIPYGIYEALFVKDSYLIRGINANMIFSVPINSYYKIESNPAADFFQVYLLPMVKLTEDSRLMLKQIISKRIDLDKFIDDDALSLCVDKSGGCIRQLIRIVNRAMIIALGGKIKIGIAEKSIHALGEEMKNLLKSEHIDILKQKKYDTADAPVLDLLFSLAVLKYNGVRGVNPLLEELI
jgi:hypothetical protein